MPATLGPKSVAVLPFANLSAEGENAYIADGLTEELRSILARIPDLKVVSRTSSFAFKGKGTPIPQIVQQLGVRHIVEGSVRQDGETVRVTAQLIDVESDTTLWSEAYERTAGDAFAIQDTIAREVANALDVELNVLAESKHGPTRDAEAYRLFLKARELFRLRRTRDNADSIALYLQAIERDPKFAEARAGLGLSYFVAGRLEESRESAEAALQQKPVALAHAVLGNLERVKLRWQTASEHMSKAVELDPSDSAAQFNLGRLQVQMGHLEEGSRRMDDALRIDPLFHYIQADIAAAAFARGDDQRATAVANKLVKSTAEYGSLGYFFLAHDARVKGDLTAAEAHLRRFMAPRWKNKDVIDLAIAALSRKVPAEQVAEALAKNSDGIAASSRSAVSTAIVLLAIGAEGAFLDRLGSIVATDRSSASTVVIYAWRLASEGKGNDPRFKEFLRKLGLPAHWKANGWPDKCRADGGDAFACS